MDFLKRFWLSFCLISLTTPALASVSLTIGFASPAQPGDVVQVNLQNCSSPTLVNTSVTITQSQVFPLQIGSTSTTVTLHDNVTEIACSGNQLSYYNIVYLSNGVQTILKSVELPAGTFTLANLANLPTPPFNPGVIQGPMGNGFNWRGVWTPNTPYALYDVVNIGNGIYFSNSNTTSGPTFDPTQWTLMVQGSAAVNSVGIPLTYTGNDYGPVLCAADANYAGKAVTFLINTPGTFATSCTLGAGHSLYLASSVTFASFITPTTDNGISCAPGVTITNGQPLSDPAQGGTNQFFYVPSGSEAERVSIENCRFNGYGMNGGWVFGSQGPSQDITIRNNTGVYYDLYRQQGALPSNPSLRLTVTGNTTDWTGSPQNGVATGVLVYGAMQHALVANNHFYSNVFGVELFATNSQGLDGAHGATVFDAINTGLQNNLIQGNDCHNVRECAWDSLGYHIQYLDNFAEGCSGDGCFDSETGNSNTFSGNTAIGPAYFALFEQEFGGIGHIYTNNHGFCSSGTAATMFGNTSAVATPTYSANTFDCPDVIGIFRYSESPDFGETISDNHIHNGVLAYANYMGNQLSRGNVWTFDKAIPSSGVGSTTGAGCGITLGNLNSPGLFSVSQDDTFITSIAQTQPALCAASSDSNDPNIAYYFLHPTIIGPWSSDGYFGASGTNSSNPVTFAVRDAQLSTGAVSTASAHGQPVTVVCTTSHKGPAQAFASLQVTNTNTNVTTTQTCN